MKANKGLSPIIAAIVLIAVTVVVAFFAAVWLGAHNSPAPDPANVHISDHYGQQIKILTNMSITVFNVHPQSLRILGPTPLPPYQETQYFHEFSSPHFEDFMNEIVKWNITSIFTDREDVPYPKHALQPGTLYIVGVYHLWFFVNLPDIGKASIIYDGQEDMWLRGA